MSALIKNEHAMEWVLVRQHCEQRLAELREENDEDQEGSYTAILRGKIAFCKEVLSLDKDDDLAADSAQPWQDLTYVE